MAATIGQKHKNGFKIVEIWDNHSESLKNNLYNDFKGPEHLLGGMNLENEIDTCQTTVEGENCNTLSARFGLELLEWIILSYSDTLGSNPCLISTSSTKKGVKMKHYLPFDLVALMLNVAEGW